MTATATDTIEAAQTTHIAEVGELTERELDIIQHQKLIEHARHQRRVGTMTKMRKQELSHAQYVVRLGHYMKRAAGLTVADARTRERADTRWLTELRTLDFRAYQAKLADIAIENGNAYFWWFALGDEQRYSLIRESQGAIRDEAEQNERYRYIDRQKALKKAEA